MRIRMADREPLMAKREPGGSWQEQNRCVVLIGRVIKLKLWAKFLILIVLESMLILVLDQRRGSSANEKG
jgi:hypothetical protein